MKIIALDRAMAELFRQASARLAFLAKEEERISAEAQVAFFHAYCNDKRVQDVFTFGPVNAHNLTVYPRLKKGLATKLSKVTAKHAVGYINVNGKSYYAPLRLTKKVQRLANVLNEVRLDLLTQTDDRAYMMLKTIADGIKEIK